MNKFLPWLALAAFIASLLAHPWLRSRSNQHRMVDTLRKGGVL